MGHAQLTEIPILRNELTASSRPNLLERLVIDAERRLKPKSHKQPLLIGGYIDLLIAPRTDNHRLSTEGAESILAA